MPKFNIYAPERQGVNVETGEPVVSEPRRVSVGWSKGRHVQVGVGWVNQPVTVIHTNPAVSTAPNTFAAAFHGPGEHDEQGREWLSQWCDMDRHTINQLIRELRKARDEAFGRDE